MFCRLLRLGFNPRETFVVILIGTSITCAYLAKFVLRARRKLMLCSTISSGHGLSFSWS